MDKGAVLAGLVLLGLVLAAPAGVTSCGATKPDIDLKQEDGRDLT